ncbi:MAG: hypothetical protein GF331_09600 [Chitinivibrionales bacterium]|nr:hypothetical protein [Chitinivibrionales bacterium]
MKQRTPFERHISVPPAVRDCFLLITCGLGVIVLTGCASQTQTTGSPEAQPSPTPQDSVTVAVQDKRPAAPATLPVEQWVGHSFAALPLSPTFSRFGYELYPTAKLSDEPTSTDPQLQLDNRRYRYDALVGKTLTAEEVSPAGDEYLVRFAVDDAGMSAFGRTHKQAIKGLALVSDLDAARQRWQGDTVYARTRQINTYDSASGKMGSISVSILTPLHVEEVRWGFGPLPPQPIWLMVSTPDGAAGFVPIQISWTNVLSDKVRGFAPWTQFILESNPRATYEWDDAMWAQIDAHKLATGMTIEQVRLSWGEPDARTAVEGGEKSRERWTYPGQMLVFEGGVLVATQPK